MMKNLRLVFLMLTMLAPIARQANAAPKPASLPPIVKRAVNAITAGDPKPLKNDLTPEMAKALTREVMQATRAQYIAPLGPFASAKVVTTSKAQSFDVTIFQMHFQKGDVTGQIAQDAKGKVAGFYVRPGTK